jgi:hypothetical protein
MHSARNIINAKSKTRNIVDRFVINSYTNINPAFDIQIKIQQ